MSITDELAAKLATTNVEQDFVDDQIRQVAVNATLEAMAIRGDRNRFTVEDSRMANAIFRILSHTVPANIHKDDIGLVPSAQVAPNRTVVAVAKVVAAPAAVVVQQEPPQQNQNGDGSAGIVGQTAVEEALKTQTS